MGEVDFNAIFGNAERADFGRFEQGFADDRGKLPQEHKSPQKRTTEARTDTPGTRTRLGREAERKRQERREYLQGITRQSEAVKRAGELRGDILKGIRQGEDTAGLLIRACECIGLMTGDTAFYKQAAEDLREIYGEVFKARYPLQRDLTETEARLKKLREAEDLEPDTGRKRRIRAAIREHEKRIEHIKKNL